MSQWSCWRTRPGAWLQISSRNSPSKGLKEFWKINFNHPNWYMFLEKHVFFVFFFRLWSYKGTSKRADGASKAMVRHLVLLNISSVTCPKNQQGRLVQWRGVGAHCIAGVWSWKIACLGGGFNYFFVTPKIGEDSHFDYYFSKGLKPPTSCFGDFHGFFEWFHVWKIFLAIGNPSKKQTIPILMIRDDLWKDCLIRKASERHTENSHGSKGSRWEWEDSEFVLHTLHPEPGNNSSICKVFLRCCGLDNCVSSKTL